MEHILIADDHTIIRRGIKMLLEKHCRNVTYIEAATCAEVRETFRTRPINYAILDLSYGDGNLFSATEELEQFSRQAKILIYSMNTERIYAQRLIGKGVKGYVNKLASMEELEKALKTVLNGDMYLSPALKEMLFTTIHKDSTGNPFDQLSDRELEVIEYLSIGLGTKEVARRMNLDATTISTFRRRAFEKLSVENPVELKEKLMLYKI